MERLLNKPIDFTKVGKIYSGRPGCMCGCKGKYTVQSIHREWADKDRGYPYDEDGDVNDRVVKLLVNKMNKHMAQVEWSDNGQYAHLDLGTRVYCAYFADYVSEYRKAS